jgi:hypothetical protein
MCNPLKGKCTREDRDDDEGHQMGLQYASYTWISRTIPARTRRMELMTQDTR